MIAPTIIFPAIGATLGVVLGWGGMLIVRRKHKGGTPAAVARGSKGLMIILAIAIGVLAWCMEEIFRTDGVNLTVSETTGYAFGLASFAGCGGLALLAGLGAESWARRRSARDRSSRMAADQIKGGLGRSGTPNVVVSVPPLPYTLKAKPEGTGRMFLGVVLMGFYGAWRWQDSPVTGGIWITLAVMGFLMTLGLMFSDGFALRLTKEGFRNAVPLRTSFFPWHVIDRFEVNGSTTQYRVAWYLVPGFKQPSALRKFARPMGGADGMLASTFGMPAQELSDLLNELRIRYAPYSKDHARSR